MPGTYWQPRGLWKKGDILVTPSNWTTLSDAPPSLLVIGAGPAGLSAAIEAKRCGMDRVLVVDREREPGGILNQCIHAGFGLFHYGEELTGPEYAERLVNSAEESGVEIMQETFVATLDHDLNAVLFSKSQGYFQVKTKAVVLAMGCRERTRAAVAVPGTRPAGVFSAGTAQRLINIEGYALGQRAVIVGSGDIGLIMARRLTLEGVDVAAVVEIRETPSGLPRNVSQCLKAFSIPLLLSHRVAAIEGTSRVTGVVVESLAGGAPERIACDLVLFSVGLIPENELSAMTGAELLGGTNGLQLTGEMQTSVPGLFACGNTYRVYDLVDEVSREAGIAGRAAAAYLGCRKYSAPGGADHANFGRTTSSSFRTKTVLGRDRDEASQFSHSEKAPLLLAADVDESVTDEPLRCIICPKGCRMGLGPGGEITGYKCRRGYEFALQELRDPSAVLTATVAIEGGTWPRLPCKTTKAIPRALLRTAAAALSKLSVSAPVTLGDILLRDLGGLGVDVVATRSMKQMQP